jgi:hypothetical protein
MEFDLFGETQSNYTRSGCELAILTSRMSIWWAESQIAGLNRGHIRLAETRESCKEKHARGRKVEHMLRMF